MRFNGILANLYLRCFHERLPWFSADVIFCYQDMCWLCFFVIVVFCCIFRSGIFPRQGPSSPGACYHYASLWISGSCITFLLSSQGLYKEVLFFYQINLVCGTNKVCIIWNKTWNQILFSICLSMTKKIWWELARKVLSHMIWALGFGSYQRADIMQI